MELPGTEGAQLFCLANDNSAKYQEFRISPLPKAFPVGFYDPLAREAAGDTVVTRGTFDRRNGNAVMAHLINLTGRVKLFNIDFNHASASVAVPQDPTQS